MLYSRRIATVEPVFANIRHQKRMSRFTLRGKTKVATQWQLYCLVHIIEKIATRAACPGCGPRPGLGPARDPEKTALTRCTRSG